MERAIKGCYIVKKRKNYNPRSLIFLFCNLEPSENMESKTLEPWSRNDEITPYFHAYIHIIMRPL